MSEPLLPPEPGDDERDAWLRAALRHAPDADVAPPDALRRSILDEARAAAFASAQAARPASPSRSALAPAPRPGRSIGALAEFWSWLARPAVATGFASVMAATLVGVMWWDRPLDEALPSATPPVAAMHEKSQTADRTTAPPPPAPAAAVAIPAKPAPMPMPMPSQLATRPPSPAPVPAPVPSPSARREAKAGAEPQAFADGDDAKLRAPLAKTAPAQPRADDRTMESSRSEPASPTARSPGDRSADGGRGCAGACARADTCTRTRTCIGTGSRTDGGSGSG